MIFGCPGVCWGRSHPRSQMRARHRHATAPTLRARPWPTLPSGCAGTRAPARSKSRSDLTRAPRTAVPAGFGGACRRRGLGGATPPKLVKCSPATGTPRPLPFVRAPARPPPSGCASTRAPARSKPRSTVTRAPRTAGPAGFGGECRRGGLGGASPTQVSQMRARNLHARPLHFRARSARAPARSPHTPTSDASPNQSWVETAGVSSTTSNPSRSPSRRASSAAITTDRWRPPVQPTATVSRSR